MVCPEGVQGTGGLGTRGLGQGESGEGEREGWGGGQEFPGVECICLSLLLSLCLCGLPGDLVFSGGTVSFWSQDKSLAASLSALSLFTSLCSLPLLASYFQLPPAFKVASVYMSRCVSVWGTFLECVHLSLILTLLKPGLGSR